MSLRQVTPWKRDVLLAAAFGFFAADALAAFVATARGARVEVFRRFAAGAAVLLFRSLHLHHPTF